MNLELRESEVAAAIGIGDNLIADESVGIAKVKGIEYRIEGLCEL